MLWGRRREKEKDGLRDSSPDCNGALHIDFQEHVFPFVERCSKRPQRRSVPVTMHLRRGQKFATIEHGVVFVFGEKEVRAALRLSRTGGTSRRRDGVMKVRQ